MSSTQFPYTSSTIPRMDCNKEFCLLMYKSHKDTLTKFHHLEQLHSTLQLRYNQLMDHRVTNGTTSTTHRPTLPTGEALSPEMFMQRTRMFEQNRMAMDRMHKEITGIQKELTAVKSSLDKKTQDARDLENRLNAFQRPQTYTYTSEQHRAAAKANEELEQRVTTLERENRSLKSQNAELIHRTQFTPCQTVGADDANADSSKLPLTCPYGECALFSAQMLTSTNPAKQYHAHLAKHRVC